MEFIMTPCELPFIVQHCLKHVTIDT